jgi:hypothetical protein
LRVEKSAVGPAVLRVSGLFISLEFEEEQKFAFGSDVLRTVEIFS